MKDQHGLLPRRVEGLPQANWVLMDYLDVIVHVFTPQTREYYRLEQLWGEAPALAARPRADRDAGRTGLAARARDACTQPRSRARNRDVVPLKRHAGVD